MVVLARIKVDGDKPVTAGVLFINNVVALSAPIFKNMIGWNGHRVKAYCDQKGWSIERVNHEYKIVEVGPAAELAL